VPFGVDPRTGLPLFYMIGESAYAANFQYVMSLWKP
jgi:hypothetical protein